MDVPKAMKTRPRNLGSSLFLLLVLTGCAADVIEEPPPPPRAEEYYLWGFQQYARDINEGGTRYVVLEDGTRLSPREAREMDAALARERYGALSPEFAERLADSDPDLVVRVIAYIDVREALAAFEDARGDEDARERAESALREVATTRAAEIVAYLEDAGFQGIQSSAGGLPMVAASATAETILAHPSPPHVTGIVDGTPGRVDRR